MIWVAVIFTIVWLGVLIALGLRIGFIQIRQQEDADLLALYRQWLEDEANVHH